MKTRVGTTGLLLHDGKVLILKRGPTAPTFPNTWDSIGGLVSENESVEDCMLREAKEEIGSSVRIRESGKVLDYMDKYGRVIAIPFLLGSDSNKIRLSFEHTEYKWVKPKELKNYRCTPELPKLLKLFKLI